MEGKHWKLKDSQTLTRDGQKWHLGMLDCFAMKTTTRHFVSSETCCRFTVSIKPRLCKTENFDFNQEEFLTDTNIMRNGRWSAVFHSQECHFQLRSSSGGEIHEQTVIVLEEGGKTCSRMDRANWKREDSCLQKHLPSLSTSFYSTEHSPVRFASSIILKTPKKEFRN